ncbi:MAG TPA: hypothetical protein VFU47_07850 [Armatimonadota bacterium]|nr:hypothetical protein [Armatimonadota bacterium]
MRIAALLLAAVLPGAAVVAVCSYFLLQDWAALGRAFTNFEALARSGADLRALHVAGVYEQAYRTNCFAEGIGVLLGALLAAVGVHGLCGRK